VPSSALCRYWRCCYSSSPCSAGIGDRRRSRNTSSINWSSELKIIRNEILLVTTNAVPGERTVRTIGYVEALSETEAASDWEYRLAEKQALLDLARQGLAMGANAIVGTSQEPCPL
jgi:hypothetical protein